MPSADNHKSWASDAEEELRRILRETIYERDAVTMQLTSADKSKRLAVRDAVRDTTAKHAETIAERDTEIVRLRQELADVRRALALAQADIVDDATPARAARVVQTSRFPGTVR